MTGPDRRLRFWVIGFLLAALALYLLRGVLLPFVAGMAIAYMLDPIADRIERLGTSRTFATSFITAIFFLGILLLIFILVPLLQAQATNFIQRVPGYLDAICDLLLPWIQRIEMRIDPADADRVRSAVGDFAGQVALWVGGLVAGLWSGGLALVNLLSLIFITPIVAFYLLRDWHRVVDHVDGWLPRQHGDTIRSLVREIDRTLAGFARGQAIVCVFLGTFYAVGLSLVGLDFGALVGIAAGLLSFIPFVGTIGGFVVSFGLALLQFSEWSSVGMTVGVFVLGHLIEANFLAPKLIGERVGLHPVWVIFALLAGGALLGFVGVLLAVPIAAAVGVLARFGIARYLESPYFTEPPEDPPHGSSPI